MKTRKLQSVGTTLLLMLFLCTNLLWAEDQEIARKKEYTQSFAARPDNNLFLDSKLWSQKQEANNRHKKYWNVFELR